MAENGPTPALSLRDAEEIVRRLMPALQEHGAWIRGIHTMLICRTPPADEDLGPDAHLRSDLGRWFRDEPNEYIRRHPEHAVATEHHRRVHDVARDLCEAVRDGAEITPADYELFVEAADGLDEQLVVRRRDIGTMTHRLAQIAGDVMDPSMVLGGDGMLGMAANILVGLIAEPAAEIGTKVGVWIEVLVRGCGPADQH